MLENELKFDESLKNLENNLEKKYEEKSKDFNETLKKQAEKFSEELNELKSKNEELDNSLKQTELKMSKLNSLKNSDIEENAEYKQALDLYLRKGKQINEEIEEKAIKNIYGDTASIKEIKEGNNGHILDVKTLRTNINPDGGYLTRPELSTSPVRRVFETSPIRELASVITIGSSSYEMLLDDDESASGGFVDEEGTRTDTDTAKIGKKTIEVHEQYAQPKVTQKLIDDAVVDIQSWLQQKTNDIMSRTENTKFVTGSGVGAPKGFLTYSAWTTNGIYEREKLEYIKSGVNGEIVIAKLFDLQDSLLEKYQDGAVFMMNRTVFTELKKQVNGVGSFLLNTEALSDGVQPRLLGKPVIFSSDMPKASDFTTGTKAIAYGNFSEGYQIVDRLGIRIIRDNMTNKPYTKFYTTKRVGGDVKNFQAIKIYELSA